MKYYLPIKRSKLLIHTIILRHFNITLSDESQHQRSYNDSIMQYSQNDKVTELENRLVVVRG